MAAVGHFGCPKFTFDHISGHFRSIRNFFLKCLTKWLLSAILDVRKSLSITFLAISDHYGIYLCFEIVYIMAAGAHFGGLKFTFDRISATLCFFLNFWQNGWSRPFWMSEIHFRWHFWLFHINTKLFLNFFLQNGRRRPFWMSEIHFWSHFWPFQIDTQLKLFWKFLT